MTDFERVVERLRDLCARLVASGDVLDSITVSKAASMLEQKPRWVPVTERLPEPKRKHYLCYLDDDSIAVCYWSNVSIRGNKWEWHNPNWKEITHWMPLPSTEGINET